MQIAIGSVYAKPPPIVDGNSMRAKDSGDDRYANECERECECECEI